MLGIFLDIETTGLDSRIHSPIEIAFKIVDLTTGHLLASYESVVKQKKEAWDIRDPGSIQINEITWEEIAKGLPVDRIKQDIIDLFTEYGIKRGSAVFVCQNPSFDRGFFNHFVPVATQEELLWPYHWLDLASMYWATRVLDVKKNRKPVPDKIILSKNEIARYYKLPPEASPHRAMNGVDHLLECYKAVLGF